jgi:hypothetical protein
MKLRNLIASLALMLGAALGTAQAAFIVEPNPNGKANANFSSPNGTPGASVVGTAPGLSGTQSIFGATGAAPGWTFSYTPGTDADNTVYTAGDVLGDTRLDPPGNPSGVSAEALAATGLVGGESGTYRVYITWPATGNANVAGSTVTVTSNIADIVLNPVDQNSDAPNNTPSGAGGRNKWLLIGEVPLTAGNTYTVNMTSNSGATFVAQRVAGVMWERMPVIPEPASLALVGLAGIGLACLRTRK